MIVIHQGNFEENWNHLSLLCVFLSLLSCSYILRLLIELYGPQHKEIMVSTLSLLYDNQCPGRVSPATRDLGVVWKSLHITKNKLHFNRNDMKAEASLNNINIKGQVV